jgi:glycosyltransferase involved in cell wall biosynthesis
MESSTCGAEPLPGSGETVPIGENRQGLNRNVRVGIVVQSGDWLGGRNYFRNLLAAIRSLPSGLLTPVLFTGRKGEDLSPIFPAAEIVRTSLLDRKDPAWLVRKAISKITARDFLLQKLLISNGVDILSHSGPLRGQTSIAVVGWIPDFQHIHLPNFFSAKEQARRSYEYLELCRHCDRIVVSSKCAAMDLASFSPEFAHKAEVLQFVAAPASVSTSPSLSDLTSLYRFRTPFFLLPNQFWAHKNHAVVIKALQLLKGNRTHFTVLATGVTTDYRQPGFFSELMNMAEQCGVLDNFKVLGPIPYDHLVGLMRGTIAFINPSYFEGWSTSVEEAKSMGKLALISDIPVHHEQAPRRCLFFDPSGPASLAKAMTTAALEFDFESDKALQAEASVEFQKRQREFGVNYHRILKNALQARHRDTGDSNL